MFESFNADRTLEGLLRSLSYRKSSRPEPDDATLRNWAEGPTIAISRQVGARGTTIARVVGAKLGWPVYDHELLEKLAAEMEVGINWLQCRDERTSSWLQERLASLSGDPMMSDGSFRHHLIRVLFALACKGHCVIVGRGAAHTLPAATTLRVRLIGALEDRVRVMAQQLNVDPEQAMKQVNRLDRERDRFVKQNFHRDPADPLQYDLILNSSRFENEEAADIIVKALAPYLREPDEVQIPITVGTA
jgi:cytidylate kinase